MEAATQVPKKYLVRNNTAGWVGVVKINHRGEEVGEAVEPFGSVWLTELEMQVTARASRLPEDNPFEEQTLLLTNPETGQRDEYKVRPLTLERDARRYTPSEERYVPTVDVPEGAVPAQKQERANPADSAQAPLPNAGAGVPAPPPVTPVAPGPQMRRAPQAVNAPPAPEDAQSWVQPPEAPGQVLSGHLDGSDEAAPDPASQPQPSEGRVAMDDRFVPSVVGAQAAPQQPGEEYAEAVDPTIGEETGQARPPSQPQPEGEYAKAEEVGSPDAPAYDESYVWEQPPA